MKYELKISGKHYHVLREHLYPGDNNEAVALAICGHHTHKGIYRLLVHQVLPIPYSECSVRRPDHVEWSTKSLIPLLTIAAKKRLSVVKFHSHPTGYAQFSETDNTSDKNLFSSIFGWLDNVDIHGSVVLLPNGNLFGRVIHSDLKFTDISKLSVIGDDILIGVKDAGPTHEHESLKRNLQTFGNKTILLMRGLKVGVVGCSGTGSPTVEQLARLGIGKITLIDPDVIEEKNLNRILNSTIEDAKKKRSKVEVLNDAIEAVGLGTEIEAFPTSTFESLEALHSLISCDFIFGCMDSIDGRHLLNQIATFYLIPYIDIGVKIIADGKGGIDQMCGNIHYIQPGGSSLQSRKVYTAEELRAAGLKRTNPDAFKEEQEAGYIVNVRVESPAVINLNMFASSIAVNEFLARIHPYRSESNAYSAVTRFSLFDNYTQRDNDGMSDKYLEKFVGRGNMKPFLNMAEFSF